MGERLNNPYSNLWITVFKEIIYGKICQKLSYNFVQLKNLYLKIVSCVSVKHSFEIKLI